MKTNRKKQFFKAVLFAMIAIALLLMAGFVYEALSTKEADIKAVDTNVATTKPKVLKPNLPSQNSPESASILYLTSPVKPGSNASVDIKTNPTSKCSILVKYKEITIKDSGLTDKVADDYGKVSWTWTVGNSTPTGTWPVKVTCFYYKKSAVVIGDLVVQK